MKQISLDKAIARINSEMRWVEDNLHNVLNIKWYEFKKRDEQNYWLGRYAQLKELRTMLQVEDMK